LAGQPKDEGAQLTLARCISIALSSNPLVLSAIQTHQASLSRIDQSKARPQLSIDYNSDLQPQFLNFVDAAEVYLGASYTFEFPGKRSLRGSIAEQEAQEINVDTDILRIELAFLVKEAFYGVLLADEQLRYAERDLELSKDFQNKAELKLAAGEVARVEVLRARVEALSAANQVRAKLNEQRSAQDRLNYLMARRKGTPFQLVGQLGIPFLKPELEELKREALSVRPEVKRLAHSVEKESLRIERARRDLYPDFDVNVSRHYLEAAPTTWSVTVSAPLSFLFDGRQRGEIAEAEANIASYQNENLHLRNTIFLEVEEAYRNSETAKDQILLLRDEILPQAEEVYEMFSFSYQEGEIGGIELIEARRTLNETRKAFAEALFDYAITIAVLEKAVGRKP
jgi:outer membrane protein TolC